VKSAGRRRGALCTMLSNRNESCHGLQALPADMESGAPVAETHF